MIARKRLARVGLLLMLATYLVGCQHQSGELQPATQLEYASTPTIAPSPTAEDLISDYGSLPCGPLGLSFNDVGEGRIFLAWTPDGAHLVFNYYAEGDVGRISKSLHNISGIWLVDAAGSRLEMLADANPGRESQYGHHADVSPDGTQLVYASCESEASLSGAKNDYEVALINVDGTKQRWLTSNTHLDHFPVWSPDGSRIAFIASPLTGYRESAREESMLFTMAADGSDVQQVAPPRLYGQTRAPPVWWPEGERLRFYGLTLAPPAWSPDGEHLAFQVNTDHFITFVRSMYLVKSDGSDIKLLAEEVVSVPAWSPDGQHLAVAKIAGDHVGLFVLAADGSNLQLLTTIFDLEMLGWQPTYNNSLPIVSWSPDGTRILYSCNKGACIIDLASGEISELIEDERSVLYAPHSAAWSPDGTLVAIYTPGDNRPHLYTVAPDGTDRRDLIRLDDDGNLVPANITQ